MELLELNQKKMKQSSIELIEEKIKFQMESAQIDRNNGVDWSMSVVISAFKKLLKEVERSKEIEKHEQQKLGIVMAIVAEEVGDEKCIELLNKAGEYLKQSE